MSQFFLKILREGLGRIIIFINFITLPKPMKRNLEQLEQVALACQSLSLYQLYACPFCVKTRRAIHRLNVPITLRDVKLEPYRSELEREGGQIKSPCLRIETEEGVQWMYESNEIIKYLERRFA
jgi:glutaredoxin